MIKKIKKFIKGLFSCPSSMCELEVAHIMGERRYETECNCPVCQSKK